ncbi:MAG: hypothetical protein AAGA03_00360 [Planctomycetota bacterium]
MLVMSALLGLCMQFSSEAAWAADVPGPTVGPDSGNRWLLVCCGLTGDQGHRERMTEAMQKVLDHADDVLDVRQERVHVLVSDETMQEELVGLPANAAISTSQSIKDELSWFAKELRPQDSFWMIVIGHAYLYGERAQFNVADADPDQKQMGDWAKGISCREQVFLLTTPVSGFWIKPMAGANRTVITATEPDLEFTGTEMPYALADVMSGDALHQELADVDQDGQLSLLDLYLATSIEVQERFRSVERLQTEHSQLDDNGDGRGSEVQAAYLPPEPEEDPEESEAEDDEEAEDEAESDDQADADAAEATEELAEPSRAVPPPIASRNLDGYASRFILLNQKVSASDGQSPNED